MLHRYRYGPTMHVHVFSASMPSSVVLLCGKEGGMLRVVRCSMRHTDICCGRRRAEDEDTNAEFDEDAW